MVARVTRLVAEKFVLSTFPRALTTLSSMLCLLFIHPPAHGSEVSSAARNTLDSARIPTASKLLICGLFQKGRVLAQDGIVLWSRLARPSLQITRNYGAAMNIVYIFLLPFATSSE